MPSTSFLRHSAPLVTCFTIGVLTASLLTFSKSRNHAQPAPTSSPTPPRACQSPKHIRKRFNVFELNCIQLDHVGSEIMRARIFTNAQSVEVALSPRTRFTGAAVTSNRFNCSQTRTQCVVFLSSSSLLPDADYVISVTEVQRNHRSTLCQRSFSTLPSDGNLVRNSGFEEAGDAPFMPTRFTRSESSSPRQWTAFYNGGLRIVCGAVEMGNGLHVQPRTGHCHAEFGYSSFDDINDSEVQKFYGAHQAIPIHREDLATNYLIGAWYRVSPELLAAAKMDESPRDSLSIIVSWKLDDGNVDDGVVVPLRVHSSAINQWTLSCIKFRVAPGSLLTHFHIYVHRHDYKNGTLFLDDVFVRKTTEDDGDALRMQCSRTHEIKPFERKSHNVYELKSFSGAYLAASERPKENQLTLAVPCTPERVLRLEAMSRLYGGGPVVAAVLVRGEEEMRKFVHIWRRKEWLYKYVDVKFVRMSSATRKRTPIPINALRNVAVSLAETEFVAMLDVDMTPATDAFACFRDVNGSYLSEMIPSGKKRLLMLPVFVAGQHQRSARNKKELMNMLGMKLGTTYCLNSQKPLRIARWYTEQEPYDVRFMAGFEPYGIGRRGAYPKFDERFVGYGFNKISWALGAERSGFELVVSTEAFVTHLNHMENDWVQSINVSHYLNTWRRYFSFVAEVS